MYATPPWDQIIEALWPSAEPEPGEKALSVLLANLRKVLAEAGVGHEGVLVCSSGMYRLERGLAWVDAEEFEAWTTRAQRMAGMEAVEAYLQAIDVYRGEYLGPTYYSWATGERLRPASLCEAAVLKATELLIEFGRSMEATCRARPRRWLLS